MEKRFMVLVLKMLQMIVTNVVLGWEYNRNEGKKIIVEAEDQIEWMEKHP